MSEVSENPEFMKTIDDIRSAEAEYDSILAKGKEKAEKILRDAKEKIHDEREKTEKEMVDYKNEKVRKGSKEIEGKVEGMIKKATTEAAAISKKKLSNADVSKLVKKFLEDL